MLTATCCSLPKQAGSWLAFCCWTSSKSCFCSSVPYPNAWILLSLVSSHPLKPDKIGVYLELWVLNVPFCIFLMCIMYTECFTQMTILSMEVTAQARVWGLAMYLTLKAASQKDFFLPMNVNFAIIWLPVLFINWQNIFNDFVLHVYERKVKKHWRSNRASKVFMSVYGTSREALLRQHACKGRYDALLKPLSSLVKNLCGLLFSGGPQRFFLMMCVICQF